jgi:myo-inositol-1-phosphate synthase
MQLAPPVRRSPLLFPWRSIGLTIYKIGLIYQGDQLYISLRDRSSTSDMAPHANVTLNDVNGSRNFTGPSDKSLFAVNSANVTYTEDEIKSKYTYRTTSVIQYANGRYVATPKETLYEFKVSRRIPKVGVMLVGWGGNNGSTVTAGIIANRRGLVWDTREGPRAANYYGSVVMGSTIKLGTDVKTSKDVNIPFHDILPMVHPNDLVIGGWDISLLNLAQAMDRAAVLEPTLKALVRKEMAEMVPLPSIYYPDFIAANQEDRADNLIPGNKACLEHVERIRNDLRYYLFNPCIGRPR